MVVVVVVVVLLQCICDIAFQEFFFIINCGCFRDCLLICYEHNVKFEITLRENPI